MYKHNKYLALTFLLYWSTQEGDIAIRTPRQPENTMREYTPLAANGFMQYHSLLNVTR